MAITPQAGYEIDPNNPGAVRKIGSTAMPGSIASIQQPTQSMAYGAVNTQPITVSALSSNAQPVTTPVPKPDTTNYMAILDSAKNQALAIQKQIQQLPTEQPKDVNSLMPDWLKNLTDSLKPSTFNGESTYNQLSTDLGIDSKGQAIVDAQRIQKNAQSELDLIGAELKAISDNATAKNLALENQGGAITAGGVQASSQANIREAAIQALPLQARALVAQAKVANAQGDVQLAQETYRQAQDRLNTVFDLRSADADREYKNNMDRFNILYQVASDQQKIALEQKRYDYENKLQTQKDNLSLGQRWAEIAGQNQDFNTAAKITSLDPNSPTYQQDLARITSSIVAKKPVGTSGGVSGTTGGKQYASDLDAIIGATLSTIPSKFGQETFNTQISKARNDEDKINLVAAQVLKGQPAEFKNDFRNQAVGVSMIDKAIAEIDSGVKTGAINNAKQYTYNLVGKDFDPALARIQGYITSAIQPYRNSVTGAAWGEQEEAEYQSLFGSTKYSPAELKQRLLQTKELLKSKSAEGLNAFVNPLGTYENTFASGNLSPINTSNTADEDVYNSVATSGSSSWIANFFSNLFK